MAIRQILLLGHTHHDVGYTNSPRLVDRAHADVVQRVVELCEADPQPGPDGFRWTFEVARPVLRYLQRSGAAGAERLRRLAAAGRVSVTGGYLNMTQLISEAELDVAYEALEAIRSVGIPIRTEQHGDVNGIAWGAVEEMRRAGIERLVMALNPDHGRPPFEQPTGFWWEGVSGARVFVWLSTHYGFGEEWGIVDGDVGLAERRIAAFVDRLATRSDYPYDTAVVHAGNDNRWPTDRFLDVVRHWNERHPGTTMRTATVDEALDVLMPQAQRAQVPVVRGEWSDWWAHGHGSTAREVAVYREARSFWSAARTTLALEALRGGSQPELATVLGYRRGPVRLRTEAEVLADLETVEEDLLLFAEHTWGSWETYSKPYSNLSHSSWNAKAGFAYGAYDVARDLAVEGFFRLLGSGTEPDGAHDTTTTGVAGRAEVARAVDGVRLAVINPTERERTEPVEVEVAGSRRVRAVVTAPAFGVAVAPLPEEEADVRTGRTVETGRYRAVVDPSRGGLASLVDLGTGRELVDGSVAHGLGAVVVEEVEPGSDHPMLTGDPKAFNPEQPGPRFRHLVATGDDEPEIHERSDLVQVRWRTTPPGLPTATTTLTLYRDLDVVDLDVDLVKPERFGPESIVVGFPFAVRDPEFLLETAGAVYAADREQLPDTSKDWYSVQHAVGVTGADGGVVWGTYDAPLVQVGGFHTGRWARGLRVDGGHINSWLMNNLHFTNFQARQEGTRRYRYRFRPTTGPVSREEVRRHGRDLAEPLAARAWTGPVGLPGPAGLRVEPADRLLAEVRPLAGGRVRVRLRNPGPSPVTGSVRWDGPGEVSGVGSVLVEPHGVADVVLTRTD